MFEKLRRAKSFIHRNKQEDERHDNSILDLSDSSHLRRNVSINSEVLEKHKVLSKSREGLSDRKTKKLHRQVSKSQEYLHDEVLEQIRRINFGDSYSKKDAQQLRQPPQEFQRHHPGYRSERNFRRRSYADEDVVQRSNKGEKHVLHRTSGDVISNFNRGHPAYSSERCFRTPSAKPLESSLVIGDSDFLLNRKCVDMSYNFDRRKPGYVSKQDPFKKKADDKNGIKSWLRKINVTTKPANVNDYSDTGSYSGCSTGSSAASTYQKSKDESSGYSNTSTASSSTSVEFNQKHKLHGSERHFSEKTVIDTYNSNVKPHVVNFGSNRAVYAPEKKCLSSELKQPETIFDGNHSSYYSQDNYALTQDGINKNLLNTQPGEALLHKVEETHSSNADNLAKKHIRKHPIEFERMHPAYRSLEVNAPVRIKTVVRGKNESDQSSIHQTHFDRVHPVYHSAKSSFHARNSILPPDEITNVHVPRTDQTNLNRMNPAHHPTKTNLHLTNKTTAKEEASRKRPYHQTKSNIDKNKPMRHIPGENRKNAIDR